LLYSLSLCLQVSAVRAIAFEVWAKRKDGCFGGSGMRAEFEKDRRRAVAEIGEKGVFLAKRGSYFAKNGHKRQ
jgi:hypothetical protein